MSELGERWEPLGTFGNFWEPLRTFGNVTELFRTFKQVFPPGTPGQTLELSGQTPMLSGQMFFFQTPDL